jgi:hypothetical protein
MRPRVDKETEEVKDLLEFCALNHFIMRRSQDLANSYASLVPANHYDQTAQIE